MATALSNIPTWAMHGSLDDVVPVSATRDMIAAVKAAGGRPIYTELANQGHDIWAVAYQEELGLLGWMFQQRRGTADVNTD